MYVVMLIPEVSVQGCDFLGQYNSKFKSCYKWNIYLAL